MLVKEVRSQTLRKTEDPLLSSKPCCRTKIWNGISIYYQRLHSGDKPYKCNRCEKAFRDAPERFGEVIFSGMEEG